MIPTADIVTNTLQIGSNNLILQDAEARQDIAANTQDISDLKDGFEKYKNGEISQLPLIPNEYIKTDGTVDTYNTWSRTDYIYIGFCKRLSVKSTVYSQYNSFYDENKVPISPFNITLQGSSAIVTVPNNAKYMRLSDTAVGMNDLVIKFYTANDADIADLKANAVTGSGAFTTGGSPTITDADEADANTIHAIPISNAVLHTPAGNVLGNLLTFGYAKGATVNKSQLMLRNDGKSIYYRSFWNDIDGYSDWQVVSGGEIIVAPGGAGDFDNLTDAIANGIQTPNSIVRIKPGVYNIVSELTQNYMDTHEFTATDRGIELNNGIHLIFDSGAFVVCNYTGTNATVHKFFSVFNVSGSCEIENLNLVASNLRYAIHDENGGNNTPYRVVWRGCNITFDNSQNPDWLSKKIIGGGLGKYADILIENCYFNPKNIDSAGVPNGCITYHNNTASGSKSHVVIRDCYFEKSTFSIRWYGNSTEITNCICCGNSFTAEPTCIAETASAPNVNVVMYAWNNEIRAS